MNTLTIVTSCTGYGRYLMEWAESIILQTVRPGRVCLFTHGLESDDRAASQVTRILRERGILSEHIHVSERLDLGIARNRAVGMAQSEWVMHLDADDILYPDAIADAERVAATADVVQAGYTRFGVVTGVSTRNRLYTGADGLAALNLPAIASGNSLFRRSLWERTPYRTDLLGAWDTCLWIGFARLGARFRPSTRPLFRYRQHEDSIFNQRRSVQGWARVHTDAMIKSLRRNYHGVAIIVPRDRTPDTVRARNWVRVRRHYEQHHPDWQIIEGFCHSVAWSKGAAIQDALNRCTAEIIVVADADVLVAPSALRDSVDRVRQGSAWAMPHRLVYRVAQTMLPMYLSEDPTYPIAPDRHTVERAPYEGFPGGGIFIVRHVDYHATGGIPFAFRGWGHEDQAIDAIFSTLLGPCDRGDADLIHLWHPPQSRDNISANMKVLRNIGHAAQHGRDALVRALVTIPRPAMGSYQATQPMNRAELQARMERRRGLP